MRLRYLALFLSLITIGGVSAKETSYRPPRLQDGHVDLQGMWKHTNLTPLERPASISSPTITAAQAQQIEAIVAAGNDDLSRPAEPSLYFDELKVEPIRGELRSSQLIEPPDGLLPRNDLAKEKTAQARRGMFATFDGPEQRPSSERCLGSLATAPPIQLIPYSSLYQIVQTADAIVIAAETLHDARVIRLNSSHSPDSVTSWLGDSIAWWDSDTLVIQTKHFSTSSSYRAGPLSMYFISPQATVEERITRLSTDELDYEFAVTDPVYYTRPWKGVTRLLRTTDPIIESACHEGNYSLMHILEGARVQEANAAAH